MKNIFPGFCKKTEKEIKKIWSKGILIFDANVLLNLYRYSAKTKNTIIELIEKFKYRIWLPHQSALEYNRNRYEVIARQEKTYKEFVEQIRKIQEDLQSKNKPPFLSDSLQKNLNKVFEEVSLEVKESINKYCRYLEDDPIFIKISEIFNDRITPGYNKERIDEIYKEGKVRFEKKIPPGYEDAKNKEENNRYGDLILWNQIIDKAKEEKKPVILITDEKKEDWWWKMRDGRNMGPRQELIEEILEKANVMFHMYSSERFLSYGQQYLQEKVNQKALDEIKEMRKIDWKSNLQYDELSKLLNETNYPEGSTINREYNFIKDRIINLNRKIKKNEKEISLLQTISANNPEVEVFIENLKVNNRELINKKLEFMKQVKEYLINNLNNENPSYNFNDKH